MTTTATIRAAREAAGSNETRAGRPYQMDGGRRVQVYLDAESIDRAEQIGCGNVSAGIREALRIVTAPRA